VLTDQEVTSNDGMRVLFNGTGASNNIMTANLTDNLAGGSFDINGWTYGFGGSGESASYAASGTLTGASGGGDSVLRQVASVSGEIKLTTGAVISSNADGGSGDMAMELVNITGATVGQSSGAAGEAKAGWMINAAGFGAGSIQMTGSTNLVNLFVADAGTDVINGGNESNLYVLTTGPQVQDTINSQSIDNTLDYENATTGVDVNLGEGDGVVQALNGVNGGSGLLTLNGSYRYFIGSQGSDIVHASTQAKIVSDGKTLADGTVEIYGGPGGTGVVDHFFKGVGATRYYGPLEGSAVIGNTLPLVPKPVLVFEGLFDSNGLPVIGSGIALTATKVASGIYSYLYNAQTQIYNSLEYEPYNSNGFPALDNRLTPDTATWLPFVEAVGAGDTTPV
jgi:hypothetical protein